MNFVFDATSVNFQAIFRLDNMISVRGAGGENDRGHDGDEQRAEDRGGEVHRSRQGSREHRQHTQVPHTQPVLGIRIRRIRMFFGHPDPSVRGTDLAPDPSHLS
jgi:hypothetical protein